MLRRLPFHYFILQLLWCYAKAPSN